ncbi:hypothetical protein AB0I53_25155 [Saccharopolyspora sp. NPDC050389]|uniref:hypothetical protein n=1 Tax=Saccharopolyspora sp. NPDC050389 TaxID=3155516 RepID=UPI0033FB2760
MTSEKQPSRLPDAPEGQGPTLEFFRESKLGVWLSAPVPIVIVLVLAVLYGGLVVLTYWFIWVLMAAYFIFLVYTGRSDALAAGADWVRFNKYWVRTYELTSIRYVGRGSGTSFALELSDSERRVELPLHVVQSNRRLWDLVYLGMRYSAASGAQVNRAMRSQFPELSTGAH